MARALGIEVTPVDDARTAVAGADIVALATNAGQKVAEAVWAEPGQHVSSVRYREMDPLLYERADRVIVNRDEPWLRHYFLGERRPREETDVALPAPPPGRAVEARAFFGGAGGRARADELTLFPNEASNYQIGAQFAAVAGWALDRAIERGLGRERPTEWFAQQVHP
jgi:hypothetical protein